MDGIINSLNAKNKEYNDQSKSKFLEAEILRLRHENTRLKEDNKSK